MPKKKPKKEEYALPPPKAFEVMTKEDLESFDIEMQKYAKVLQDLKGETYLFYDQVQYLKDNKALDAEGALIIHDVVEGYGRVIGYRMPTNYDIFDDKLNQWKRWRGRKEFAKKKEKEDTDKIADVVQTPAHEIPKEKSLEPEIIKDEINAEEIPW